jgi:Mn-dependent DtxR family transcriptional regulator
MTSEGEQIGKQMMRNTRLLEVLMKDALKIEVDEEMICGIEHHMKDMFTDALRAFETPKDLPSRPCSSKGQVLFVDFYSRRALIFSVDKQ